MKRTAPRRAFLANEPALKKKRLNFTPEARALNASRREIVMARKANTQELKVTYHTATASVSNAGYVFHPLINMAVGTGVQDNFIGNEVLPTSIRLHFSVSMGPVLGAGDGTNVFRVVLFQWDDASAPVVGGVLQAPTSPLSMGLWINRENITVLADRLYGLKQYADAATSYDIITDKIYIKSKKLKPVKFSGGTLHKGGIYAVFLSDSALPPAPYLTVYSQMTYTDS